MDWMGVDGDAMLHRGHVVQCDIKLPTDVVPGGGFEIRRDRGQWAIYYGVSKFLVAEGPGWSWWFGRQLFESLNGGDAVQM